MRLTLEIDTCMIQAIEKNLERGIQLLHNISDEQYSNTSVAPYHSSIGGHMRHILDVFSCIFDGLAQNSIDFSARERNEKAELFTAEGIRYFEQILNKLKTIDSKDYGVLIPVSDNLGLGTITIDYTLGAALVQAHSHAIHHFASVGFIINQLGIQLPDADFGYNPTTPKKVVNF